MGEAEWLKNESVIRIHSDFYFYGEAASDSMAVSIANDIANHWNEPGCTCVLKNSFHRIEFFIRGFYEKDLTPETVWYNTNPRNNYFQDRGSFSCARFIRGWHSMQYRIF